MFVDTKRREIRRFILSKIYRLSAFQNFSYFRSFIEAKRQLIDARDKFEMLANETRAMTDAKSARNPQRLLSNGKVHQTGQ